VFSQVKMLKLAQW